MIPLLHDFTDERVLVFGGGLVGARRARTFGTEASVVVISPSFVDDSFADAELIRAAPPPAEVESWIDRIDPVLVVAATDDTSVNEAVAAAARERGLLHNRADRAETTGPGDVSVPAITRDDPVVVAVGTGGTSHALASQLRARYEADIDGAGAMAHLLADLRSEVSKWPTDRRREALTRVIESEQVWKALGSGDPNAGQLAVQIIESMGDYE